MARRVALAHDYLLVTRGAERTFAAMAAAWPEAPIHTTLYDEQHTAGWFAGRDVRVSPLQKLHARQGRFRSLMPLFPAAVRALDVSYADVVVSSSSAFAHGVRPRPDAVHVCYCHSPFRYAWHERRRALQEVPRAARPAVDRMLERTRRWDMERAQEVTRYIANSRLTQQRLADFYGREAEVIHPPVEVERFKPAEPEDFFLIVGELVSHKRTAVALEGARLAGQSVKVVGDGPDYWRLVRQFPEAQFLGRIPDAELADLYARCRALLVPSIEEFGITAVEAQAAGRPVIAPAAGGAAETVVDGITGILLEDPTARAFAEAIRYASFDGWWTTAAVTNAQRFCTERFQQALRDAVDSAAGHREQVAFTGVRTARPLVAG